jgi:hypothetical protein
MVGGFLIAFSTVLWMQNDNSVDLQTPGLHGRLATQLEQSRPSDECSRHVPLSSTFYLPRPDHKPESDQVSMTWAGVKSETWPRLASSPHGSAQPE